MKALRVFVTVALLLAAVAFAAPRALADGDNWLIGAWTSTTADGTTVTYVFTADTATMSSPTGGMGPAKVTYAVNGDTVACTMEGGQTLTVKRVDATHATASTPDGKSIALSKQ